MGKIEKHEESKKRGRGNPQWVKGQSGNPKGRPRKEVCLTSQLKQLLLDIPQVYGKDGKLNQKTGIELVALAWLQGLLKGNPVLLKEALERLEGKIAQPLEHTGDEEKPIKIEFVPTKRKKDAENSNETS